MEDETRMEMTARQQHIFDLNKTLVTLSSALIAAFVGFLATAGLGSLGWGFTPFFLVCLILSLITTVSASLLSMGLLSNRLLAEPPMGPRPVFVAAEVALVALLLAMLSLTAISLGELFVHYHSCPC